VLRAVLLLGSLAHLVFRLHIAGSEWLPQPDQTSQENKITKMQEFSGKNKILDHQIFPTLTY